MFDDTIEAPVEGANTETKTCAYKELREFVHIEIDGADGVDLPSLVERAQEHFDTLFFARLGRERLNNIIYAMINGFTRPTANFGRVPPPPDRTAEKMSSIFTGWHEFVERGRKVSLPSMTREDVTAAKLIRFGSAARDTAIAKFFGALERKMKPGQLVGEVFTTDELTRLAEQHRVISSEES